MGKRLINHQLLTSPVLKLTPNYIKLVVSYPISSHLFQVYPNYIPNIPLYAHPLTSPYYHHYHHQRLKKHDNNCHRNIHDDDDDDHDDHDDHIVYMPVKGE